MFAIFDPSAHAYPEDANPTRLSPDGRLREQAFCGSRSRRSADDVTPTEIESQGPTTRRVGPPWPRPGSSLNPAGQTLERVERMHSRAAHVTNGTPLNGARTLNGERRRLTLCGRTRAATLNASPHRASRGARRRDGSGRISRTRPRRVRPLTAPPTLSETRSLSQVLGIASAEGWPCSQRSRPETGGIPDPRRTRRAHAPSGAGDRLQGQSFCGAASDLTPPAIRPEPARRLKAERYSLTVSP